MGTGSRSHGFWQTVPGMLTAVAAVITAVGGLIAVLPQLGVLGGADDPAPATTTSTSRTGQPATPSVGPAVQATAGTRWSDVAARWTLKDGKVFTTRAETVRFCFSGGAGVNLDENQSIAFEKMKTVEVLRSDVALSPGGKATLRVTMADGQVHQGTITSGCDFFGFSEDGTRYSLYPDKLLKIEFLR